VEALMARLRALLDNVAWAKRNCRHCDRPLWLVRVNGGYNVAYTAEGATTWKTARRVRSRGKPLDSALMAAQDQTRCNAST
jgi:hypothetical protein